MLANPGINNCRRSKCGFGVVPSSAVLEWVYRRPVVEIKITAVINILFCVQHALDQHVKHAVRLLCGWIRFKAEETEAIALPSAANSSRFRSPAAIVKAFAKQYIAIVVNAMENESVYSIYQSPNVLARGVMQEANARNAQVNASTRKLILRLQNNCTVRYANNTESATMAESVNTHNNL